MSILALPKKSILQQIAAIKRGFPSDSISVVARELGLPEGIIIAELRIPAGTVARDRHGRRLDPQASERLLRVIRVWELMRMVFTSNDAAARWLRTPKEYLDGETPLRSLETGLGAERVEALAKATIHGVPLQRPHF